MKDILITGLKGPFAQPRIWPLFWRLTWVVLLTLWTQVGGLFIWPTLAVSVDNIGFRQRFIRIILPVASYMLGTFAIVPVVAGWFGMRPLPCFSTATVPIEARSALTCISSRNYVQHHVFDSMTGVAKKLHRVYPKLTLHYMDASHPFKGLPVFPHMHHSNGLSVDMSYLWKDKKSGTPIPSPSPVGYFAYVQPTYPRECAPPFLFLGLIPVDLRHDLDWLQPWFPKREMDLKQTRSMMGFFTAETDVEQLVIEPHLLKRMGDLKGKVVKNKCDQSRHDDHFNVDFKPPFFVAGETEGAQ